MFSDKFISRLCAVTGSALRIGLTAFWNFLRYLMICSFLFLLMLFSLNEVNRDLEQELVRPLWQVLLLSLLFGTFSSMLLNKKGARDGND
jgi:hypothetical protein